PPSPPTTPSSSPSSCHIDESYKYIFLPLCYSVTFLLSLVLNSIILHRSFCGGGHRGGGRTKRWTPSLTYMVNLATTDLMYGLSLPFLIASYAMRDRWVFGDPVCRLVRFLFYFNLYCSLAFLACISLHRYLGVCHPLRSLASGGAPPGRQGGLPAGLGRGVRSHQSHFPLRPHWEEPGREHGVLGRRAGLGAAGLRSLRDHPPRAALLPALRGHRVVLLQGGPDHLPKPGGGGRRRRRRRGAPLLLLLSPAPSLALLPQSPAAAPVPAHGGDHHAAAGALLPALPRHAHRLPAAQGLGLGGRLPHRRTRLHLLQVDPAARLLQRLAQRPALLPHQGEGRGCQGRGPERGRGPEAGGAAAAARPGEEERAPRGQRLQNLAL
ncbi:P2Y purinoceptor 3-like, partial [Huso huso]